jgi:hypothetical protein
MTEKFQSLHDWRWKVFDHVKHRIKISITTQLVTEKFQSSQAWQLKFFCCHKLGYQKHSVTNHVVTKFFFNHRTSIDLGHPIDNGLISTIDLEMKFVLPSNKM